MAAFSLQDLIDPCFCTIFDASDINYQSSEKAGFTNNEPFLSNKCGDESTVSMVDESFYTNNYSKVEFGEQVTQRNVVVKKTMDNKRELINSSQSMDGNEVKSKRQKKSTNVRKEDKETKVKKPQVKKVEKKIISEEAPTEYVHVRARRGQATDSHSLAERARREKIREKMKILQGLVPGCDKVTGKALMLDEIINYVQSLQNQVELLSMKSASLNPAFFEFGTESDNLIMTPDQVECHEMQRLNAELPIICDTFTGLPTQQPDIYPLLNHATSSLLFDPQIHSPYAALSQDGGQSLWDVILDHQGQFLYNELGFMTNNLCSFQ